ncbi:hypothetical protein ACFYNO_11740 [Kitasatospora sp. NPDC006697]|uniref:hypothetical protein n=1 Tax=Kitasatospora sp. NPDC006697 TaxID=3364020 RepID=UPI003682396C
MAENQPAADGPADEEPDPQELAGMRFALYVETLKARMPGPQYELLMEVLRGYLAAGGGRISVRMDAHERELFGPEVRRELLVLLGLLGGVNPEGEDRSDYVVADLGDGDAAKQVMRLVPPEVAGDPERLRAIRDEIDSAEARRRSDRDTVEAIARASGMAEENAEDAADEADREDGP